MSSVNSMMNDKKAFPDKVKRRKRVNPALIIGCILLSLVILLCIVSFFYMPYAPNAMDTVHAYQAPTLEHWFGTDHFGRDILSRIMVGSRTVLLISFVSVTLGALVGCLLGATAALWKGVYGAIVMRTIDGLMAFPGTLLALMMVSIVGKGETGAILAISIYTIVPFARLIHSLILENESLLLIKAARSFGITRGRLLTHYYLPMILPRLLTQLSASVASAIMTEAALSFLGLGVQAPNASWGLMLADAKSYCLIYPYLAFAPGIAIFLTVLAFHLVSDGISDMLLQRTSS